MISSDKFLGNGLTYDDVLLVPSFSEILPREVSISSRFSRNITLNVPIVSADIEKDFDHALEGIFMLPETARLGVYTAYKYYRKLLYKLKNTPSNKIQSSRISVPNYQKMTVLAQSYLKFHLKLL